MAEPNPNTSGVHRTGEDDLQQPEDQTTPNTVIKQTTSRLDRSAVEIRDVESDDDSQDLAEEDPDQWLLRQNAKSAAIYQRKLLQQAKKKGKTLAFDTPSKARHKKKDMADHGDGRSGELGGNVRARGYAKPREEPDGYESSSSDSGYKGKKHTHASRDSEIDDDLVKPFRLKAFAEKSKFVARIAAAKIPRKAKLPSSIGRYDGLRDPDDHVHDFECAGMSVDWPVQVWCHLFAQTLTGAARVWFDNLPAGSVKDFDDLTDKFGSHFSHLRKHKKDKAHILLCRRYDHETIEDYIIRFNKEALQIGCGEELTRVAFIHNVRSPDLMKCLTGKDGIPES